MKIKGAFPVRWAAQNGSDGKGVTIVKTEIKYTVSTSGNDVQTFVEFCEFRKMCADAAKEVMKFYK